MSSDKRETATLAGGCFWCIEAALRLAGGVEKAESGYMGGAQPNPTYEAVCGGDTGHAEVAQILFDPTVISFSALLDMFFVIHDPTTLNQQGNDTGSQYRSAIFYHSGEQKRIAEEKIAQLTKDRVFDDPIVTEVTPATEFFVAENYHQEYFRKNPNQPYCRFVVAPKVDKMRKQFMSRLKKA
ncbi:MAG: peptide-methionine (S)-S-oxide reductase MsrA [Burkholderiales bacterium]